MKHDEISASLAENGRCHTFDFRGNGFDQAKPVTAVLDEYVSSLLTFDQQKHFHTLGDKWEEISQADARLILIRILAFDLAYNDPDMDMELADTIVESFLSAFGAHARYFTNGTFGPNGLSGWNPLTTGHIRFWCRCAGQYSDRDALGGRRRLMKQREKVSSLSGSC